MGVPINTTAPKCVAKIHYDYASDVAGERRDILVRLGKSRPLLYLRANCRDSLGCRPEFLHEPEVHLQRLSSWMDRQMRIEGVGGVGTGDAFRGNGTAMAFELWLLDARHPQLDNREIPTMRPIVVNLLRRNGKSVAVGRSRRLIHKARSRWPERDSARSCWTCSIGIGIAVP